MEVILDRTEETSISIDGDFEKNSYSKNLKKSFFQALAMNTKLSDEIKFMPGMSGKKYRYFINNFVSQTDNPRYLEIGSWTGSTVCSALYGNAVVDHFSKQGPEDSPVPIAKYNFVNIFPVTIAEIPLDWSSNDAIEDFTVEFAYDYWTHTDVVTD